MTQWKRNLWILSACVFTAQIAFTIITPFLPMYLEELGATKNTSFWSGMVYSINSLTFAIMAPVWGSLSDRTGKRIMLLRSGLGIGLTYLLMGLCTKWWQLLALRALNGALAGYIPSAIMLVSSNSPEEEIGFALSMIQTFVALGGITGPFFGGILAGFIGIRNSLFLSSAVLTVISIIPFVLLKEEVHQSKMSTVWGDFTETLKSKRLVMVFTVLFLANAGLLVIQPTLPLYMKLLVPANPEFYAGLVFSIVGVSTAIGSPMLSRNRRFRFEEILLMAFFIGAGLTALQGMVHSVNIILGLRFLFGFANAAITVSGNVLIAQSCDRNSRGKAFGVFNGISSLGAVLGPMLGGFMGNRFGLVSSFFGSAFLLLAGGLITLSFVRKQNCAKNNLAA